MTRTLAVWDVDGTLLDSRRSIAEAMAQAFLALGLPAPSYDQTRHIVGLSLEPAIKALAPDLDPARYGALATAYKDAFVANRERGLSEPLYAGARELILALKDDGRWALGIATGKSHRGVAHFLDVHGLGGVFDAVFCADDGPGKPHPHMLQQNMAALGFAPQATVMIGDTSHDMAMARAASVYAQGVSWGFHTVEELHGGGAHHVAEIMADLTQALALWRGGAAA